VAIDFLDNSGRHTPAGTELRAYAAGTRRLTSSGIVDTRGGYCSQNVIPVHLATADAERVDVEVTAMSNRGRHVTMLRNVDPGKVTNPFNVRF
jgi:hypothetical protein